MLVDWIAEEGYATDSYYVDTMTFEAYHILNASNQDDETVLAVKEWSAYMYLKNLGENCKELSLREFNVSRFIADYEVSSQVKKGK